MIVARARTRASTEAVILFLFPDRDLIRVDISTIYMLTRITLLRILLTLVTTVKPVANALDGTSKETFVLSNMTVSSVVVVGGGLVPICAHK